MTDQRPHKTRTAWNEARHAHLLTYSCVHRWPLLNKDRTRAWVVEAMDTVRRELGVALLAYVIMPEHVHLLLHPQRDNYEMRRILAALKRPVAGAAKAYLQDTGNVAWLRKLSVDYPSRQVFRFWQPGGGFDENIFHDRTLSTIIDYIHANPVRRGLVPGATNWAWSSARFWAGYDDVPLRMDVPDR